MLQVKRFIKGAINLVLYRYLLYAVLDAYSMHHSGQYEI